MFCKNCGKEIDDESKFCQYCGTAQKEPTSSNSENDNTSIVTEEPKYDNPHNVIKTILYFALIILLLIAFIACAHQCTNTKNATINDVTITDTFDLEGVYLRITPKEDIEQLELTVTFYSSNDTVIKWQTLNIGDVNEDNVYTKKLSFSGLELSDILKINYVRCTVSGGTIK